MKNNKIKEGHILCMVRSFSHHMFQDLKNVGLPAPALTGLFGSAEEYLKVWQRSVDIGATLPH